jgi:glycosyltransferase involved in cell wall biosynthesis
MVDSISPVSWFVTASHLRKRGYDLVIFKFWHPFFGPAFGTIARQMRREGVRVMIVVDNLIAHTEEEAVRRKRSLPKRLLSSIERTVNAFFTDFLFRYCSMAVTQSSTVRDQLAGRYPHIPQRMLPHPTYEQFGKLLPQHESRAELGITASRVILFFGLVRRYKGLDRLLEAMPEIVRRIPDVQLLVVGEFYDNAASYLEQIERGGVASHITIVDRYVPDDEVARWFSAADLLVLPYHHATNSGIVQIGYNFARPAVVTNVGSLGEVVIDGRTGFVIDDPSPGGIATAVERAFDGDTLETFARNIIPERDRYSWDTFVDGLVDLAESTPAPSGNKS